MKLVELAQTIGKRLVGDPDTQITSCSSVKNAKAGSITYLENEKFLADLAQSKASAAIVPPGVEPGIPHIVAENPAVAFAKAIAALHPAKTPSGIVHPSAVVADGVEIGRNCEIGPFASVRSGCSIGDNVLIHSGVAIGENVSIGDDCVIFPNVTVYSGCRLGNRTIIHAGCVIGGDGFKFVTGEKGAQIKFPHLGIVRIGDDVEIGANSCIDRATLDETVIGNGVKIDNLVQIGHNCAIGDNTVIAGCTGISGSVIMGKNCVVGGQVGIKDHVKIAAGTVIAAKSGVIGDIEKPGIYCGFPAVPIGEWRKQSAAVSRGPETLKRVSKLEKS